jgi:hypothetical protein
MKKLLMPNNISAPLNTPDEVEDEVLHFQMNEFEEKYREKIPWIMSLSQQLVSQKNKKKEKETETRETELDAQEPRQPEKPKPSNMRNISFKPLSPDMQAKVKFQPYKSTRPDLLQKLTSMITKGLFDLQRSYENGNTHESTESNSKFLEEKFLVYAYAFERYIDESTLYKQVLESIHDAYHEYIYDLQNSHTKESDVSSILERREQEHEKKIQEMQQLNSMKYQVLQETNKLLEKKIYHIENDKHRVESDYAKLKDTHFHLKKEFDELKASCMTLTSGLSRMEEEHRVVQSSETNRMLELSHSKATEQKLTEEIER